MQTLENQIQFYNHLSEAEKLITRAMAIRGAFDFPLDVVELLRVRVKITQKVVVDLIARLVEQGIIKKIEGNTHWLAQKYRMQFSFMAFIYTDLENCSDMWKSDKLGRNVMYFRVDSSNDYILIKSFLYQLLYEKIVDSTVQNALIRYSGYLDMFDLTSYPAYMRQLHKLNPELINILYFDKLDSYVVSLAPLSQIAETKKLFESYLGSNSNLLESIDHIPDFLAGRFRDIIARGTSESIGVLGGIHLLLEGDVVNSVKQFDLVMKNLRKENKSIQVLPYFVHNYFYFTALLRMDPQAASIRARKILVCYSKMSYSTYDYYFKTVLFSILNQKNEKSVCEIYLKENLLKETGFGQLLLIALAYLSETAPPQNAQEVIIDTIRKGYESGNLLLTYEAAFVADKWYGTAQTAELYRLIAERMNYEPACSQINRQEDWEKSVAMLFSAIGGGKSTNTADTANEVNARVIYHFYPNYLDLKPVYQSRNAKGVWSKGRNIAMKTLKEGKTPGMTDQDVRISQTIKQYGGGYYDEVTYEFSKKVWVEIIGHPYVFLAGSGDIPVEFVAAQPIITVTNKGKGYLIESDIADFDSSIFCVKETNTRYLVYNLSTRQSNLLRILTQQSIVIPEHGREKLIQLLGEVGKYATVHSDLLSDDKSMDNSIKSVVPDYRIRVQLLPFGDGLKAELYAKPFGDFPPYSKPGKGGKVLITNYNGERLQVKRNLAVETTYANALMNDIQQLEGVNLIEELITFDHPLDSLHLLDVINEHKEICVVEWPEGERFKIKASAGFPNLNMRIKTKNNWFELEGELRVDEDTVLSLQQLMGLISKSNNRFVELKEGEFLALSADLRKRMEELYSYSSHGKNGVQINKFASVALNDLFDDIQNLKTDKAWKQFKTNLETKSQTEAKIPTALQAELRPYQEEGFRWMVRLSEWEAGACLADDMGLGKTVQTLGLLLHRASLGAALVVCPVSVVGNWIAEAERFAPTLNIKTIGNSNREQILNELGAGDVLVTSYGLLQSEEKLFIEKEFATVVLDEAHIIKNYATKTSKATMQLKAGFRLALTGTPLQNHQGEIWNLFNFINPGLLGSMTHFTDTFIKPNSDSSRKLLKKLIQPFILRRTKTAVLDELPPKTEIVRKIRLSDEEMAFYEALRRQAVLNLESDENNQGNQLQVLAEITKLRQASCNPLLVDANIGIESSKMATFLEIVSELIENKHRALVFSQFVSHLSLVRKELDRKGIAYKYLDGSTPMAERERNVREFQNGEGDLFLISLKAGGLGLNLTAADYVIHMDPWWNPAIEDQASDRAHRYGQKRPVTIYRLVAENTIEEKIIQLHNTKRDLAESLLEGSDQSAKLSYKDLLALISMSATEL